MRATDADLDRVARPATPGPYLRVERLELVYRSTRGDAVPVLNVERLELTAGAKVGVTGPSGSGKTSLLYLLSGIEMPNAGRIRWGEVELTALAEARRDRWRRRHVGFVFQEFHLQPGLSVVNNVLATCYFDRLRPSSELQRRARALLERVGAPVERSIVELSRGEQQRVAIARALLRAPPIIMADEPTASLDEANARIIIDLLLDAAAEVDALLIAVTHDPKLLARLPGVYHLEAGRLSDPAG
jgi:putative ABC transport system ATP-binding protein